jgi:hypothetical protein
MAARLATPGTLADAGLRVTLTRHRRAEAAVAGVFPLTLHPRLEKARPRLKLGIRLILFFFLIRQCLMVRA